MLQFLHEKSQTWISWVIVSVLALGFGLWGIQSYLSGRASSPTVAKVNGASITQTQLNAAYKILRQQYISETPSNALTQSVEKNLKSRALKRLVIDKLLAQAAEQQGFEIGNQQLLESLYATPNFLVDGHFSQARFEQVMNILGYSEHAFLAQMKNNLLIKQPQRGIVDSAFALPREVHQATQLIDQKRTLRYFTIPKSRFLKTLHVTDKEIQHYYKQHLQAYMQLEKVKIQYLALTVSDLKKQLKLTQQQAETEFSMRADKLADLTFSNPNTLAVAAKALKLPVKTTTFFTAKGAKQGIAKYPAIAHAAFSQEVLGLRNNSDLINTQANTAVVLRVLAHQPAHPKPLAQVKTAITTKLKQKKARQQIQTLGENLLKQLRSGRNFATLAKTQGVPIHDVKSVSFHAESLAPAILAAAFHLPRPMAKPTLTGIMTLKGYTLIEVTKTHPGTRLKTDSKQYLAYKDDLESTLGNLDYDLYSQSVFQKADITPHSIQSGLLKD